MNILCTLEETEARIRSGERLLLAGDEALLRKLPKGNWIGGTTPYFIGDHGGVMARQKILNSPLPQEVTAISTCFYDEKNIRGIASDGPEHGFTFIIIPGMSSFIQEFAKNVNGYPGIFNRPLMGWVSGVALDDVGLVQPKVVDGRSGEWSADRAVVLHATLEDRVVAEIAIINPFTQGDGDVITVDKAGFVFSDVWVNGKRVNLARYLTEQKFDTRLPLVANYLGAMVNASIRSLDPERREVVFYAPLFPDIDYKLAAPVKDYEETVKKVVDAAARQPTIAVSCIMNYARGCLDCPPMGTIHGPISFGEIAYGLLNQTLVYMMLRSG